MKLDIEYEIWRFDEWYHGFEMDAKENLPAGSIRNIHVCNEVWVVPRFFHREN